MKHYIILTLLCALSMGCEGDPNTLPSVGEEPAEDVDTGEVPDTTISSTGGGSGSTDGSSACSCEAAEPGQDGVDGSSCSVVNEDGNTVLSCTDGSTSVLAQGESIVGPAGPAGPAGESIVGPQGDPGMSIVGPQGPAGASVVGPQGERGLTGDTGPAGESIVGPAGSDGDDGVDGSVINTSTTYVVFNEEQGVADVSSSQVSCSGDDFLLTGGCTIMSPGGALTRSQPLFDLATNEPINSWHCQAKSIGSARTLTAYAVCLISN